jgi:protein-S-isoprenylcysteine O-methyltransferase Ste14
VKLAIQSVASVLFGLVFFGVSLFVPAWTWHYWQGWVFIGVFIFATMGPSIYIAVKDPAALARRMTAGPTAETRPAQRIIITAVIASVVLTLVVSALDHRFGWSTVPIAVVIIGNILVFAGLTLAQVVIIQNSFASANITVAPDQPLVSTGLYGIVRHPMYSGTLVMMIGTPLALDSYWGLLAVAVALPILAARILDEEALMRTDLAGYPEYVTKVRYRLIPRVW